MHLHPAPTREEIYQWLRSQITEPSEPAAATEMETTLQQFAEAMTAVASFEVADDVEPLLP
jgi:hypothetical protein